MVDTEAQTRIRSQLAPLLSLTGIFLLNFLSRIVFGPLMPTIEKDLGVGHAEAGSLFLCISVGYCIGLLGSGLVSSQLNHRRTILISTLAIGAMMPASTFSTSIWWVRITLTFVGIAAGLYLPSGIATITSLVQSRDWGKAIGIHELAPNIGLITAPLLVELLLGWTSWRSVPPLISLFSLIAAVAFLRYGQGGVSPGEAPRLKTIRVLLKEPSFWIMTLLFSMGIGASLGVYTMLPLYLVTEIGMDRGWANTLVALSRISGLFIIFVAGWVTDRVGPRQALGFILFAIGTLTISLGLVDGSWILLPVLLQPMLAVCFFPPGFAALARVGPSTVRSVTVSMTIPIAFLLGGGAVPAIIGVFGELASFAWGMGLVGGMIVCASILVRHLTLTS